MRTRKSIVLLVYLLLLSVGLVGCGGDISQSSHNIKERIRPNFIVGGDSVKKDSFKAVVALRIGESVCTGTLNSPTEISTAAHCFMGVQDVNDFSPSPKKMINTLIEEKEQELLDRGEHDQYEMKLLILDFLTNFMAERGIQDTKIYFSNEGRFAPDMIKGMKGQKRWLRHFVDDYFEHSGDTFLENFSKRLTDVSDRISFLIQSSTTESPKSSPRNWWRSIHNHPNADQVTLILHDPIYNIPAISWIKESEWEEAVLDDIFGVGFGLQFDPEFISSKNSSLVERFFNLHNVIFSKNFRERKARQQWDQYLKWRLQFQNKNNKNLIPIPKKSKTAPLQIQGAQGNLIVLTTHDLTLSGSCSGDSGGPVLVRLKNGELRQIATFTSSIGFCGSYSIGTRDTISNDL